MSRTLLSYSFSNEKLEPLFLGFSRMEEVAQSAPVTWPFPSRKSRSFGPHDEYGGSCSCGRADLTVFEVLPICPWKSILNFEMREYTK